MGLGFAATAIKRAREAEFTCHLSCLALRSCMSDFTTMVRSCRNQRAYVSQRSLFFCMKQKCQADVEKRQAKGYGGAGGVENAIEGGMPGWGSARRHRNRGRRNGAQPLHRWHRCGFPTPTFCNKFVSSYFLRSN